MTPDTYDLIDVLLTAHEHDLESFIEMNRPNMRLVFNDCGDDE